MYGPAPSHEQGEVKSFFPLCKTESRQEFSQQLQTYLFIITAHTMENIIRICQKIIHLLNLPLLIALFIVSLFLPAYVPTDTEILAAIVLPSFYIILWVLYEIALIGRKDGTISTKRLLKIVLPTLFIFTHFCFFVVYLPNHYMEERMFFTAFVGNIIAMVIMILKVRSIGKLMVSIEKGREAKAEEYAVLSFLIIFQTIGIPLFHNRIQRALLQPPPQGINTTQLGWRSRMRE